MKNTEIWKDLNQWSILAFRYKKFIFQMKKDDQNNPLNIKFFKPKDISKINCYSND